ncbi:hypothetical protein [Pontibacter liquoris]|uniref:hypothetical protein n=1 Tax=Pontibacter liquoris TaxID=2905677 RepID=UPI001FA74E36|nr:hypothetical protein [Pontibacter liquoris]
MKYMLKYSFAPLLLVLLFSACRKEPNYPDTPEIEFRRVDQYTYPTNNVLHDSLVIVLGYKDGDGDLGLNRLQKDDPDSNPPYNSGSPYEYNFFASLQIKKGDQYVPLALSNNLLNLNGRFQRLTSDSRAEALEGEIKYSLVNFDRAIFDFFDPTLFSPTDTIRFEIYIYDRALHKSNVVVTDDLVLFTGRPK